MKANTTLHIVSHEYVHCKAKFTVFNHAPATRPKWRSVSLSAYGTVFRETYSARKSAQYITWYWSTEFIFD
jgi:hypothetical protein